MSGNETRFVGWHRSAPNRPWRRVVEAPSEAECRDLLEARVEEGDIVVLPSGKHPLEHGGTAGKAAR